MDIEKELKEQEKTLKLIEGAYYECVGTIKYFSVPSQRLPVITILYFLFIGMSLSGSGLASTTRSPPSVHSRVLCTDLPTLPRILSICRATMI